MAEYAVLWLNELFSIIVYIASALNVDELIESDELLHKHQQSGWRPVLIRPPRELRVGVGTPGPVSSGPGVLLCVFASLLPSQMSLSRHIDIASGWITLKLGYTLNLATSRYVWPASCTF